MRLGLSLGYQTAWTTPADHLAMAQEAEQMSAEGFRIKFTVEPNSTHRLKSAELGLSKRLFDEIESCR